MNGYVFISYSQHERSYVVQLARHLEAAGVPCWYDHELAAGDRWHRVIEERINGCAALVVVMTPEARDSDWVNNEIIHARELGKPIAPLLLSGHRFVHLAYLQYELSLIHI